MKLAEATRAALRLLVAREEAATGSREIAYANVSRIIGASNSWTRKFCAGDPLASEPRLSLFERIRIAYVQMCVRVALEKENELKKIEHLRGELNAVDLGMVGASALAHHQAHT